jgi:adenosine kinase
MSTTTKNLDGAILGMCNPLLDISVDAPTELLEKYGLTLNNAILAEDKHLPLYTELIKDYPVQYIAGGATQNSIRVAQWMLGVPGSTSYFGAIGADEYGATLEKCALEDGVKVIYQKNPEVSTGTCAVLVNNGERSLVANLAAANTFTHAHLDTAEAKEAVAKAQIVYISGFFLTVSMDSIMTVAKQSVEEDKIFCMNISAPFLVQFFGDQMAATMPYTDFIFANESEAAIYGETHGYGADLNTIALKLAAQPKACGTRPRTVVFTQGSDATIVCVNGIVTSYPVDPLPKAQLVDTNGAGDAFVGGFLAQLILDRPMADCVRAGHFAARTIIQRSGCTFPKECTFA